MPSPTPSLIHELLTHADITINGSKPWDIQVNNERFYTRLTEGTLGLGESYMDGDWDCKQIDVLIYKLIHTHLQLHLKPSARLIYQMALSRLFNLGRRAKSREVIEEHYNLGNDVYEATLDPYMQYTCGYWKDARTLNQAQEAKLDLICRKLGIQKGMKVLDIGGGWGGFAKFAAKNYNVEVVNVTLSSEQIEYANKLCQGLSVENRLQDYRDVSGQFDRIVVAGMIEHVGYKNYRLFMEIAHKNLREDGLFLLHTIGSNKSQTTSEPWIMKYIFPNSMLPSIKQLASATEGLFIMEDWHNLGAYYDKTLLAWFKNFDRNWPKLKNRYDERFYRMWKLYLLSCAGSFRARNIQLWQIVLSPKGVLGGYTSIR